MYIKFDHVGGNSYQLEILEKDFFWLKFILCFQKET